MGRYSLGDAARILKVSPERLRYWERTALLRLRNEVGTQPSLDFRDLVGVRSVLGLIEQGISLRRIRRSVDALRDRLPGLDDPVSALRLWSQGSARVVVEHDGVLEEPDGQTVLDFRNEEVQADALTELPAGRPVPPAGAGAPDGAAASDPSAVEWFERGCDLDAEPRSYAQAVTAYRHAIEIDPDFADAHCNLGAVFYNQGQRGAARRCFERCVELEPGHVEGNFNLANLLEEGDQNDLALQHYLVALKTDSLYPDLHVNLALLHEKVGRQSDALGFWRRYLSLAPGGSWSQVARHRLER